MLRLAALALVVVIAGCGASTARATRRTASSARAASPSVVAITPSPTPSGTAAELPVSTVGFSCRLPIVTYTVGAETPTYQGGFITFPSGSYSADPDGVITMTNGYFVTKKTPALTGFITAPSFDAAAGRWVPSTADQISPDGSAYAYTTGGGPGASLVHVVNISQGTDRTYRVAIPDASPAGMEVEDDDGSEIFLS